MHPFVCSELTCMFIRLCVCVCVCALCKNCKYDSTCIYMQIITPTYTHKIPSFLSYNRLLVTTASHVTSHDS